MLIRKFLGASALLSCLLAPLPGQAGPLYSVTALPTGFLPVDINNRGQIAGTVRARTGHDHAGLLSDGTIIDLDVFGGAYAEARSLNDAGAVAGSAYANDGVSHGFIVQDGNVTDLGAGTNALRINNRGEVVGQVERDGGIDSFVYTHGSLVLLDDLTGHTGLNVRDINDAGAIVGNIATGVPPRLPSHPVLYQEGTLTDLGTLAGRPYNDAQAINNAGRVAGFSEVGDGALHAFIYEHGVLTDVGTFGGPDMFIRDINESGIFVGYGTTQAQLGVGFAYINGALVDVNTLIDPASGWILGSAFGINDAGQIVAEGCRNGVCTGVRLDPLSPIPEPQAALLMLPGLVALGIARRRARTPGERAAA